MHIQISFNADCMLPGRWTIRFIHYLNAIIYHGIASGISSVRKIMA
jgi:hypothetical protein